LGEGSEMLMEIIDERLENYYIEKGIKLTEVQKENIKNTIESVSNFIKKFIKDFIEPVWEMFNKIFNTIDWNRYKRYLKYKKRIKNRRILYIKHKAKYNNR
jgi:hypothetical protein